MKALDKSTRVRIFAKLRSLSNDPRGHGTLKLSGYSNMYRTRVGEYRVIFEIHDDELLVLVVRVGHRAHVYENLPE